MKLFLIAALMVCGELLRAQTPHVSSGRIVYIENFKSRYVNPRNVDVWLPDNYNPKNKYAVLYMQDGQSLFDSSITWNKQEWGVDETMTKLIAEGKIQPCIVVGIWNVPKDRHADYFPQKAFETLSAAEKDTIYNAKNGNEYVYEHEPVHSDNYLKFMVYELKPYIDSAFATKKDCAHTFVAGSSMGGLISMYAICEYPQVFGGAACLSTHWPGIFTLTNNPLPKALLNYLKQHLPDSKTHKLYFDHGTATLDAMYPAIQKQADAIIAAQGYSAKNFMSKVFPGEGHSEKSWRSRLAIPLQFLLGK